ncbi:hypothetical protein DICA1_F02586 [Diutina catenulata]
MDLATRLWTTVTESPAQLKVISVIPGKGLFEVVTDPTTQTLEIGLSKDTYLALFKQCHDWQPNSEPWDQFVQTVGYLATTNENHTMLTRHWTLYCDLSQKDPGLVAKELDFVSTLLSSRLKRINKSSSVWLLLRRLLATSKSYPPLSQDLVARVEASMAHHFANYYAGTFMRWHVSVLVDHGLSDELAALLDRVGALCRKNLADVTLWSLYGFVCQPDIDYYVHEYRRLGGEPQGKQFDPRKTLPGAVDAAAAQLRWLRTAQCKLQYPYAVLEQVVGPRLYEEIEREANGHVASVKRAKRE